MLCEFSHKKEKEISKYTRVVFLDKLELMRLFIGVDGNRWKELREGNGVERMMEE